MLIEAVDDRKGVAAAKAKGALMYGAIDQSIEYSTCAGCGVCIEFGEAERSDAVFIDGRYCVALLSSRRREEGAVIVAPKRHVMSMFGLSEHEFQEMLRLVQLASSAVQEELGPDGLNIWWPTGSLAGQTQPHFFAEVSPRWRNKNFKYTDWDILPLSDVDERAKLSARYRTRLRMLGEGALAATP